MPNMMTVTVNSFFFGYLVKTDAALRILENHEYDALDRERALAECAREAFVAGARWELRESAKLSPHIARFLEMLILLGPDAPRDQWLTELPTEPDASLDEWCEHVPF